MILKSKEYKHFHKSLDSLILMARFYYNVFLFSITRINHIAYMDCCQEILKVKDKHFKTKIKLYSIKYIKIIKMVYFF